MVKFFRRFGSPLIWCVALGYTLVISGVPLTGVAVQADFSGDAAKRLTSKDRSRPFPCMDSPCGCVTAEQCFAHCCCHTPAETLAWVEANRVSVDVLQALKRRVAKPTESASSCCGEAVAGTATCDADYADICFEYEYLSAAGSVDPQQTADAGGEAAPLPSMDVTLKIAPVSKHTVVLKALLACGGLASQWLAVGNCLLPAGVVPVACGQPLPDRLIGCSVHNCGERAEPPAPPPRLG